MDRYKAIYRRKSVRKYSDRELRTEKIKEKIEERDELYPDIESDVEIVKGSALRSALSGIVLDYGKVEAPYYMVVGTEEKEGYLENVGYSLEPIVLDLTRNKIGSCWLGGKFDKKEVYETAGLRENLEPIILIAFGHPAEGTSPWRDNRKEAKRKELSELIMDDSDPFSKKWKKIIDAARMAPSAVNSQPWRVKKEEKTVHLYISERGGILDKVMKRFGDLERLNHIDAGISLSHLKIAADHLSKDLQFGTMKGLEQKDHQYIISLKET